MRKSTIHGLSSNCPSRSSSCQRTMMRSRPTGLILLHNRDPHLYQSCLAITAPLDMRSVCRTGGYVLTTKPGNLKYQAQRGGFATVSNPQPSPRCSLTTVRASLSSRSPANFECRRWFDSVHSRNSIRATISGLTQTHLSMSAAVSPSPQRPLYTSGRLANGHFGVSKGLSLANTWRLEAGTKPFLTFELREVCKAASITHLSYNCPPQKTAAT